MKKSVKIITLLLSALLLIGAIVGISVSAESDRVSIAHKNLSYEGAIKVLYAVETNNLNEGETVAVRFFENADDEEPAYVKAASGLTITLDGVTYDIVFSEGIAPKDMRKAVYAQPVLVGADGEITEYGETVEYSIWKYATNRFEKSPSEEQLALYTAMLNYGASVQKVLMDNGKYTEDELLKAGGYANEYCGIKVDSIVDGETVASSAVKYYAPGDKAVLGAAKTEGDCVFEAYFDKDGEQVGVNGYAKHAVTAEKAGITEYRALYVNTGATPLDYSSEDAFDSLTLTTTATTAEATAAYTYVDTVDGLEYTLNVVNTGLVTSHDGILDHERHYRILSITNPEGESVEATPDGLRKAGTSLVRKNTDYPEIGEIKKGSEFRFLNLNAKKAYTPVARHVFDTDILYTGNATTQSYLMSGEVKLWGFNVQREGDFIRISQAGNNSKGEDHAKDISRNVLPYGEWFNLRIEYYDLFDGEFAIFVYVNGELCPPKHYATPSDAWIHTSTPDHTADDVYITSICNNFVFDASQMDVYYDNTYFATEYLESTRGLGKYFGDSETLTYDCYDAEGAPLTSQTYTNISTMYRALGFYSDAKAIGTPADGSIFTTFANDGDDNYVLSGSKNLVKINSFGWYADSHYTQTSGANIPVTGDIYVFETDMIWNGAQNETLNSSNAAYFRLYGKTDPESKGVTDDANALATITITDKGSTSSTFSLKINSSSTATIKKGEWFNLRVEITPVDAKTVVNKLYINNCLLYSKQEAVKGSLADASLYNGAYIYLRAQDKSGWWNTSDYSYGFDNTYVGTIDKNDYAGGGGVYYNDATIAGTRYNFESGETLSVYDAETNPDGILAGALQGADSNKYQSITEDGTFKTDHLAWKGFSFANKGNKTPTEADKLVFETDFTWLGGNMSATQTDNRIAFTGFTSSNENNAYMKYAYASIDYENDRLYLLGAYLEKGIKYNIRAEYIVATGKIDMYINNNLAATITPESGKSFDINNWTGFGWYSRGKTTDRIVCEFDNVFLGIVTIPTEETPAE